MDHDHAHHHPSIRPGPAFAIGIALNLAFVLVEAGFGWRSGSILASIANAVLLLVAMGSLAGKPRSASARRPTWTG